MLQIDKSVTVAISWDDGLVSDLRLIEILKKYDAPTTFGLSSNSYASSRSMNDHRHPKYGMRVCRSELKNFADYDIWNHTANHKEITILSKKEMFNELYNGKRELEDIFQKEISGVIWPYGSYSYETIDAAIASGHFYGRSTPASKDHEISRWTTIPIRWCTNLREITNTSDHLAISGHTYELVNESDWSFIDGLYAMLTSDSKYKLVTLTELIESCLNKSIHIHSKQQDA